MNQWPVWLGIMIVCGLIAYMGDALGRRLGKKRLTVLGLRPRRTAVLVTTVTGCLIFAVSLASIVTISKEHREWVLRGVQTVHDLEKRKADLEQRTAELLRLASELEQKSVELDRTREAVQTANRALSQARDSLLRAEAERNRIQASLRDVRARQSELQRRNRQMIANLEQAQERLALTTSLLESRSEELRDLAAQRDALAEELKGLEEQVSTYREEVDTLAKQNESLARENLALEKDKLQLQITRDQLQAESAELSSRIAMLGAELSAATGAFGRTAVKFRTEPILFPIGTEVVRRPVRAGGDIADNVLVIRSVLDEARSVAKERGAAPGPDGDYVAMLDSFALSEQGHIVRIPLEQVTEAIAEALSKAQGDLVLIARAAVNSVASEPLVVGLEIVENPVVFRAGEPIAQVYLDPRMSSDELMERLVAFLRDEVSREAREKGMIPAFGKGESIGEVTYSVLDELIKRVRRVGRTAKVTALAARETKAGDRLQLTFDVTAAK